MHSATATHLTSERGENLSRDAQNAMFKAADTVPAGDSVQSLQLSQKQFCPRHVWVWETPDIFINFSKQFQNSSPNTTPWNIRAVMSTICARTEVVTSASRSGGCTSQLHWDSCIHTISMSDPVCCSARSHCSSIRRVVSWSKSQRCAIYLKLWNMDSDIDQFCLAFSRIISFERNAQVYGPMSVIASWLQCCGVVVLWCILNLFLDTGHLQVSGGYHGPPPAKEVKIREAIRYRESRHL